MCELFLTFCLMGLLLVCGGLILVVVSDKMTISDLKMRLQENESIKAAGITGVYWGEMK